MSGMQYYSGGPGNRRTRAISVTSGKGGVGKTTMICNLAAYLATKGNRVLILDGDLGMSNVDIMFKKRSRYHLHDVITGAREIEEVVENVRPGVDIISGGSGVYELQNIDPFSKRSLLEQVERLSGKYDFLLIDTAPGISDNVLYLNASAEEVLITITPDPTSLTDAYALIKVLNARYRVMEFSVICNMMKDEAEAKRSFAKLSDVCSQFLNVSLDYRGFVPMDLNLRRATKSQQLVLNYQPRCPASFAIRQLGENIMKNGHSMEAHGGVQMFWQQLVGVA